MTEQQNIDEVGIFHGLSEDVVNGFAKDLQRVWHKKGEAIIMENTQGDNLFYICHGRVEINKGLENEETPFAQLSILHPGEFFGEMSIINDEPRSATVVALDDVELLVIPRDVFVNITFSHPVVMFNLIRTISGRLRNTNDKFIELMNQMISKNRLMAIGLAASKIIHDIKSPLTVIVLTAQLLENLYPDGAEYTDSIIKQTKLVDQMVREILDFAKGTEIEPLIQKVDLDAYFKDLKDTYGTSLKSRDINFVVENKVSELVHFDENKIKRVLLNLLKNSSEALTDKGEIRIVASLSAGWLQISLIDDGPGIPEEIRNDLFKPFVTSGKAHGTGLGLAICKKILQEHKGRLEYIPVQPHGARFDIRIPQSMK
ncbi:MAG: cyclic nucleotide-binding domain-containing protein [Candidatus Cloacimonetes bacterium]|nr:cyclic nucleotide-binding domain-containing protein [Candidatus Cloacimonadota bacterium]HNZ06546.1 cyclic nucleotide-binding domain-containing protein [Candidatus Cloacimonadota bacterium]HOH78906.1 cyclic nucleotide-binding domain-containing protein [Candidatus Cloacimonadota bacterium]HPN40513.1 cyclic nucleotide-binding domain-containing protein [Candidatus Cloacimonadota bacterium]